ncbi:MAG: hypothetical protein Q7R91_01025 [bacterium]|nr:hypothetical protein [bacterium]
MAITKEEKAKLIKTLIGGKIAAVRTGKHKITITCKDGSIFKVLGKSGQGADSEWYNWTEISINNTTIMEFSS